MITHRHICLKYDVIQKNASDPEVRSLRQVCMLRGLKATHSLNSMKTCFGMEFVNKLWKIRELSEAMQKMHKNRFFLMNIFFKFFFMD